MKEIKIFLCGHMMKMDSTKIIANQTWANNSIMIQCAHDKTSSVCYAKLLDKIVQCCRSIVTLLTATVGEVGSWVMQPFGLVNINHTNTPGLPTESNSGMGWGTTGKDPELRRILLLFWWSALCCQCIHLVNWPSFVPPWTWSWLAVKKLSKLG